MNLQNIPSHATDIRAMFVPSTTVEEKELDDDKVELDKYTDVKSINGDWIKSTDVELNDVIVDDIGTMYKVVDIYKNNDKIVLTLNNVLGGGR